MLRYALSGNFNGMILHLLVGVFVVFCTLPIHEYAHAYVANKLGDDTAKWMGRLTLNPLKHIDPIGSLMIVLFGIGWAKPVPINANNFKNFKRGMALTALAGPASNVIMSFFYLILANGVSAFFNYSTPVYLIFEFFFLAASINASLAVFNLLPIPPLDGSRIFNALFPDRIYFKIMEHENVIRIVLIIALFTGVLSTVIGFLSNYLLIGLNFVAQLPFRLFA